MFVCWQLPSPLLPFSVLFPHRWERPIRKPDTIPQRQQPNSNQAKWNSRPLKNLIPALQSNHKNRHMKAASIPSGFLVSFSEPEPSAWGSSDVYPSCHKLHCASMEPTSLILTPSNSWRRRPIWLYLSFVWCLFLIKKYNKKALSPLKVNYEFFKTH